MSKLYQQHKSLLEAQGFEGFVTVQELLERPELLPDEVAGVYQILWASDAPPDFLEKNPGYWRKKKDPTVDPNVLAARWNDLCPTLYIGKADRKRERLRAYIRFGQGHAASHWGGRLIWQLADAHKLVVCWKRCDGVAPRELERSLIADYEAAYRQLPFANLRR